jgi:cytochrome c biogenesis factor
MTGSQFFSTITIIVLLSILIMVVLNFFDRKTRKWGCMIAALVTIILGFYKLYTDITAYTSIFDTMLYLVVYIAATIFFVASAVLQTQKMRDGKKQEKGDATLQDKDNSSIQDASLAVTTDNSQQKATPKDDAELQSIRERQDSVLK